MSEKKKKPFPQFKHVIRVTFDELSAHLTALVADGYPEWTIVQHRVGQTRSHYEAEGDRPARTIVEPDTEVFSVLAWWEDDEDDE